MFAEKIDHLGPKRGDHLSRCSDADPYAGVSHCWRNSNLGVSTVQSRMSKDQLLEKYSDPEWRDRFMRLYDLTEILSECIIRESYTVPDELNNAIALTDYGNRYWQELRRKFPTKAQSVPSSPTVKGSAAKNADRQLTPNVARLMCLLTLTHLDVLIDVMATDIEKIEASIDAQVLSSKIRFPFIFGRELYDRAAELFPTERASLSVEETDELLEGTSPGVLQAGRYIVGPLGLVSGRVSRDLSIYRSVPLFHCADPDCDRVHRTELATDFDAPVNRFRTDFRKMLDEESKEGSDWGAFLSEISGHETRYYLEDGMDTLPFLVGDALSDKELRRLAEALIADTGTRIGEQLGTLSIAPTDERGKFKTDPSRAVLLQVILLATDEEIVSTIDNLVYRHRIDVPAGEVRRPMVNQRKRSGAFGLQVQLSRHGIAARPSAASFSSARLRALLGKLYELGKQDEAELDWQLRGVEAPERDHRLEEFYRNSNPREILRRLVFSRYSDLVAASHHLGLRLRAVGEVSDEDLIDALLWKLGYASTEEPELHAQFWRLHGSLRRLTAEANVSTLSDVEAIRSVASNYFVALEGLLFDALTFSTWALTTDHFTQTRRFVYEPDTARPAAVLTLNEFVAERASDPETLEYFEERTTLYALCRGFAVLADGLAGLESQAESRTRDDADVPDFVKHTQIQSFPFTHTALYLDLTQSSRIEIREQLRELSRSLVAASVHEVRNSYLHFRRSQAELDQMSQALDACEAAVRALEQAGLARSAFHLANTKTDEWGRTSVTFHGAGGREIVFARPSRYEWSGVLGLGGSQYMLPLARFGDPGEVVRFLPAVTSPFSKLWSEYPRRRARNAEAFVGDSESGLTAERHGSIRQPAVAK